MRAQTALEHPHTCYPAVGPRTASTRIPGRRAAHACARTLTMYRSRIRDRDRPSNRGGRSIEEDGRQAQSGGRREASWSPEEEAGGRLPRRDGQDGDENSEEDLNLHERVEVSAKLLLRPLQMPKLVRRISHRAFSTTRDVGEMRASVVVSFIEHEARAPIGRAAQHTTNRAYAPSCTAGDALHQFQFPTSLVCFD